MQFDSELLDLIKEGKNLLRKSNTFLVGNNMSDREKAIIGFSLWKSKVLCFIKSCNSVCELDKGDFSTLTSANDTSSIRIGINLMEGYLSRLQQMSYSKIRGTREI